MRTCCPNLMPPPPSSGKFQIPPCLQCVFPGSWYKDIFLVKLHAPALVPIMLCPSLRPHLLLFFTSTKHLPRASHTGPPKPRMVLPPCLTSDNSLSTPDKRWLLLLQIPLLFHPPGWLLPSTTFSEVQGWKESP